MILTLSQYSSGASVCSQSIPSYFRLELTNSTVASYADKFRNKLSEAHYNLLRSQKIVGCVFNNVQIVIKEKTQRGGKVSCRLKVTAQNTKRIIPYNDTEFDHVSKVGITYLKHAVPSPIGFPKLNHELSVDGIVDPALIDKTV